ncbi:MAG: GGDEF domain-containing protein [Candidatus Omnitrophota bacterium]|nr:GGDEF domain-containing protein [Candidatus Omnitrophota bacterium]
MRHIIVLILLSVFLYLFFKRILFNSLIAKIRSLKPLENEYDWRLKEEKRLRVDNSILEKSVNQTTALYDITKDICKTLNEVELFNIFKERIAGYIKVEGLEFIKSEADLTQFKNYFIFPLSFQNSIAGYLVVKGIEEEDKGKFYILGQQYTLGLKRALLYEKVQELAIVDNVTQASTRRHFMRRFEEEFMRSGKFNHNLTFLMIDIDHFKECNDHYGHLVGDVVLKEVSKTIKDNIRQIDFMGRYGGEELSVILVETNKENAYLVAERIRQAVELKYIAAYDEVLRVTISIGISVFPIDALTQPTVIDKADEALYRAKGLGRNKVCCLN